MSPRTAWRLDVEKLRTRLAELVRPARSSLDRRNLRQGRYEMNNTSPTHRTLGRPDRDRLRVVHVRPVRELPRMRRHPEREWLRLPDRAKQAAVGVASVVMNVAFHLGGSAAAPGSQRGCRAARVVDRSKAVSGDPAARIRGIADGSRSRRRHPEAIPTGRRRTMMRYALWPPRQEAADRIVIRATVDAKKGGPR